MNNNHPPLLGYADQLAARPGETVEVKVSSYLEGEYTARLVRTICADPNPEGMGLVEEPIDCSLRVPMQRVYSPLRQDPV